MKSIMTRETTNGIYVNQKKFEVKKWNQNKTVKKNLGKNTKLEFITILGYRLVLEVAKCIMNFQKF